MPDYLTKRNGHWQFTRRVPTEFAGLDPRGIVKHSTKIAVATDKRGAKASKVADAMNRELEAYWRGLTEGKAQEAADRYAEARRRARAIGFDYVGAQELATRPLEDLVQRYEKLLSARLIDDAGARTAVLGFEAPPAIMLSEVFTRFQAQSRTEVADMSPGQLRAWASGYTKALNDIVGVLGDKQLSAITHADILDYIGWLEDRIAEEEIVVKTANRKIGQVSRMIKDLNRKLRLGLPSFFADMLIRGGEKVSRPPFPAEWVQGRILAEGALMGLSDEARRAVMLIADTGLRVSEAVNLNGSTIHLNGSIPYVEVKPDGRRVKTKDSIRTIPLVGVALAAMRLQPSGFPRYADRGAAFSEEVGRYLTDRGLRPTPKHTLYSLRHTFKDRLIASKCQDSMIDALMGHASGKGYKYGDGPALDLKAEVLHAIAFKAPAVL